MTFEPLEAPLHPPQHLPSPHSVLAWQAGDPFDMAVLLASLLLGGGYDAYVVAGYAPKWVTLRDLSQQECPLLAPGGSGGGSGVVAAATPVGARGGSAASLVKAAGAGGTGAAAAAAAEGRDTPGGRKKYQLRPKTKLSSKIAEAAATIAAPAPAAGAAPQLAATSEALGSGGGGGLRGGGDAPSSAGGEGDDGDADADAEPPGPSKRVHAWVLVLPGRREV